MKKPKPAPPGHEFASEEEKAKFFLDHIDQIYGRFFEQMSLDTDIPRERCVALIKEFVREGRYTLEINERNQLRFVPAPSRATN